MDMPRGTAHSVESVRKDGIKWGTILRVGLVSCFRACLTSSGFVQEISALCAGSWRGSSGS